MLKKRRLIASILLCVSLVQPVYAGTINLSSPNDVTEYTYYKVFDVTKENEVGWRRVWCNDEYNGCTFECDLLFYGSNDEDGTLPWVRDDEAELLRNHQASLVGIDNDHARTSTFHCVDDERTSMDGDLIWPDGKIKLGVDHEGPHYFMYQGSPWISVVRKYSEQENSGVTLKACNSPYKNEIGLYLVTFDGEKFDSSKFQKYLYNNIPSDALLATSTSGNIQNVPIGYYIVKAEYTNGEIEYVGNVKITEVEKSESLNDDNSVSSTGRVTITVCYEDEKGNTLLPTETFDQQIGKWYEMVPKSISGYESGDYPANYKGWCQGNMTVTFTYIPKS